MRRLTVSDLEAMVPQQYRDLRPNQRRSFEIIAGRNASCLLEEPVGSGKTLVGYSFLRALQEQGRYPLFYVTQTKAQVEQVHTLHPDLQVAYGRHEYPCLYYEPDESYKADEIPCLLLQDCPHRVDQTTGQTLEPGFAPCPYYQAKFEAKRSGIVVCTMAFYLFTQLFSREWETPAGLVLDEVHALPKVVRNSLSYEISDYHLGRSIELLREIDGNAARQLDTFRRHLVEIIRRRPARSKELLEAHEIEELLDILERIEERETLERIKTAVRSGQIDVRSQRETLRKLELLIRDLRRYRHSLSYSVPTEERQPLNYTFAYYEREWAEERRVRYTLVIKAYYVAPIIQRLLSPFTVAYSATIGDPRVFGFESGITRRRVSFTTLPSDFPVQNTRLFMPTDTPDLSVKRRRRQDKTRTLRRIARACRRFSHNGHRSLVVVISDDEREKFLALCQEEHVAAVSYGNGVPAKEAIARFKAGEGSVLVGTAIHVGEGLDLPNEIAPVIFFLRPGYPHPDDPATVFEERRFGSQRWSLWTWRVVLEALQARGRNVRSAQDRGVTFFVSQQFQRFLYGSLPEWLKDAYVRDKSFDEGVEDALELLR